MLTHASGVLTTLVMSFDAVATRSSNIEIHGELGTLAVPDPNYFAASGGVLAHYVLHVMESILRSAGSGRVASSR